MKEKILIGGIALFVCSSAIAVPEFCKDATNFMNDCYSEVSNNRTTRALTNTAWITFKAASVSATLTDENLDSIAWSMKKYLGGNGSCKSFDYPAGSIGFSTPASSIKAFCQTPVISVASDCTVTAWSTVGSGVDGTANCVFGGELTKYGSVMQGVTITYMPDTMTELVSTSATAPSGAFTEAQFNEFVNALFSTLSADVDVIIGSESSNTNGYFGQFGMSTTGAWSFSGTKGKISYAQ